MTEQTGKTKDTTPTDSSAEQITNGKTTKDNTAETTNEGSGSKVRVGAIGKYWMENDKLQIREDVKLWDGCCLCEICFDDFGEDSKYQLVEVASFNQLVLNAPVKLKASYKITDKLLRDGGDTLLFYAGEQKTWKSRGKDCCVGCGPSCAYTDALLGDAKGNNNDRLVVTYMTTDAMFKNEADDNKKLGGKEKEAANKKLEEKRKKTFEAIEGIARVLARYMLEEKDEKPADLSKMTLKHTDAKKIYDQYNEVVAEIRGDDTERKVTWAQVKSRASDTKHRELCEFADQSIEDSNSVNTESSTDMVLIIVFGVLLLLLAILVFLKKTGKLSSLRILQQTGPRSEESSDESSEAVGYLACTIFSLLAALTMGFLRRSSMHRKIASHVIDIEMERPFANEV